MANLRDKKLRNGALIAMDYETGQIVAYQGSANPTATKATKRFQPRFDVLADGWRQPGSAFKPVVYATGIDARQITAASMFMDVVTNFGGGYTPTDADNLERGPVRVRNALQFSLNIPAVKALAVIGNDPVKAKAEAMGVTFRDGQVDAGLVVRAGRGGGPRQGPRPRLRHARERRQARLPDDDRHGDRRRGQRAHRHRPRRRKPDQVLRPGRGRRS